MIVAAGLAVAIGILVSDTLNRRLSTDVFWSLTAGQWMIAHHRVIGLDPFSYTESHRRWVADEWGSEVILASLYKAFGVAAYNIFSIVTGSFCLICSTLYARAVGAKGGRLAIVSILLAIGIAPFVTQDRGLSLSLIWLPLELLVLTKGRTNPRLLWWLPLICLAWVNTHGSILLGLGVIVIELVWSLTPERLVTPIRGVGQSTHRRPLALALIASVLAACISPYGPALLGYDLGVSSNSQIAQNIIEWGSPNFQSFEWLFFFGVPLAVFFFAARHRNYRVLETTVFVFLLLASLRSERLVVYLMLVTVGVAASIPARDAFVARTRRITIALGIGAMIAIIAKPAVPAGTVSADTPVQAYNFLAAHPGRIFTQYTWADYSIARGRQTFVDGRTDLFVGKVFSEYLAVNYLTTNPDPILSKYHVDYVVYAPSSSLGVYLSSDPRWLVVDRTAQADVYARRSVWNTQTT